MLLARSRPVLRFVRRFIGGYIHGPVQGTSDLVEKISWTVVSMCTNHPGGYRLAPLEVHVRIHTGDVGPLDRELEAANGDLSEVVRQRVQDVYSDRATIRFPPDFAIQTIPNHMHPPGKPECVEVSRVEPSSRPFLAHYDHGRNALPPYRVQLQNVTPVNEKLLRPIAHNDEGVAIDLHATIRVRPDTSVEITPERGRSTVVNGRAVTRPVVLQPCTDLYPIVFGQTRLALFWAEQWSSPRTSPPAGGR